jgi:hypothetical protein
LPIFLIADLAHKGPQVAYGGLKTPHFAAAGFAIGQVMLHLGMALT